MSARFAQNGLLQPSQLWRRPDRVELPLRKVGFQKIHFYQCAGFTPVVQPEIPGIIIFTDNGALDRVFLREQPKAVQVLWFDRDGHPLLGFGDPNFPLIQAVIFEGDPVQVDPAAIAEQGGLTDRGGKPAAPVIGDEGDETLVPRFQEKVVHFFLGVGIADLDMARRGVFAEGLRCRRNPMNTVLSHPAAGHDDKVAG